MTLTKVEEQIKNYSNSVSYQLDGNSNPFFNKGLFNEMKFEMNCNNKTNGMTRSLDDSNNNGIELKPVAVPIGSSVLSAAVDISKLANFGKTRRESGSENLSQSFVSLDASISVLPSRTLLRRQRRMQSQDAEDKQEDSIERLNRLRARISGALSEVKGVLKQYSTDDSIETEQPKSKTIDALEKYKTQPIATIKNDGPVNFRFVKKIRRRSTFSEDDAREVEKETVKEYQEHTINNETPSCTLSKKSEVIKADTIFLHVNNVEPYTSKNTEDAIGKAKHKDQVECSRTSVKGNDIEQPAYLNTLVINEYPMDSGLTKICIEETEHQENSFAKSKCIIRRASIAAVEGSRIEPPIQQAIPITVKTERRTSDSETVTKRKLKTSDSLASNAKEKVTTLKRLPMKNKTGVTMRIGKALEINQYNNNAKEDSSKTSEETAAVNTKTELAVPDAIDTLSTQLAITIAIDDASLKSAERPDDMKSEAIRPLSMATNNSWSPTHSDDGDGVMVTALVNSLQTVEASSHSKHLETQPSNALIKSEKVVKPVIKKVEKHNIVDIHSDIETTPEYGLRTQPEFNLECNLQVVNNLNSLECSNQNKNTAQLEIKNKEIDSPKNRDPKNLQNLERQIIQNAIHQLLSPDCPTVNIPISNNMPELQVTPIPVKPLHVFAENNTDKINSPTKSTTVNQVISNTSADEPPEITEVGGRTHTAEAEDNEITDYQLSVDVTIENPPSANQEHVLSNDILIEAAAFVAPIAPLQLKKNRKVKKKVIIKRQHRKLSVGENTFFKDTEQPDSLPAATETLEKAIAYVTDDEDDGAGNDGKLVMPIKSCMKAREFQVGDWVMYGERFRKTQIRWKKGQISERITSISYKINIDNKEVSAHINYIKKYTGRRVNFGGKEYLEIDYEQLAEEEHRAHTYSIWNMV